VAQLEAVLASLGRARGDSITDALADNDGETKEMQVQALVGEWVGQVAGFGAVRAEMEAVLRRLKQRLGHDTTVLQAGDTQGKAHSHPSSEYDVHLKAQKGPHTGRSATHTAVRSPPKSKRIPITADARGQRQKGTRRNRNLHEGVDMSTSHLRPQDSVVWLRGTEQSELQRLREENRMLAEGQRYERRYSQAGDVDVLNEIGMSEDHLGDSSWWHGQYHYGGLDGNTGEPAFRRVDQRWAYRTISNKSCKLIGIVFVGVFVSQQAIS
jgi:hypothetical protein